MRIYYNQLTEDLRVKILEHTKEDIDIILEYQNFAGNWQIEKTYHAGSEMEVYGIVEHEIKPEYVYNQD